MSDNPRPSTYVATCLYGLEPLLADEVHERCGAECERHWCEVVFPFAGSPARLAELRLAGNLFLRFDSFVVGHTRPDLDELAGRLAELPMGAWEERRRELGELAVEDVSVTVSRRGEHNYTYADVEERALEALRAATGRKTTLDARALELRVEIDGEHCRLLGRLTPAPLSERPYLRYHMPSETEPTLAAAMIRLSGPRAGDAVLDPFCGVGVIPIERALAGPAGLIAAGEDKEKRLAWAAGNAGAAGVRVSLGQWDAFRLPFGDRTFDRIVTVPPQGDPASGKPWEPYRFAELMAESLRVLGLNGNMVCLLRKGKLLRHAMKRIGARGRWSRLHCSWKGRPWTIHTLSRAL